MKSFKSIATILISGTFLLSGCASLKKMKNDADKITYKVTPEVLETHGGTVVVEIQGRIPEKYFIKKATLTATPVLNYAEGETAYEPYLLQGESVKANNKVISYNNGGSFSYKGSIPYTDDMRKSDFEIRIRAQKGKKTLDFAPRKIADGVLATSTLVDNSPLAILGVQKKKNLDGIYDPTIDKFQRIVPEEHMADLLYLINSSEVRGKELTKDEMERLNKYIVDAYTADRKELKGVEVSAYASPDGKYDLNSKLAEKREGSASKVVEKDLQQSKVRTDIKTKNTPEDWEGFKALMEKSNIQDKELILRVLSMYSDPEVREREIKNLSSAFTSVADEILPKLRRAKITAAVDLIGKTDAEIMALADSDPSKLNQAELLYAATLTNSADKQKSIYNSFIKYFGDDWRGYNNLGLVMYNDGDAAGANMNFQKADQLDPKNPIVQNNLGAVALKINELTKAEEFFGAASGAGKQVNENLGVLKIKQGQYDLAVKYLGEETENVANRALAQLQSGDNNGALRTLENAPIESGRIAYLKAVIGARTAKTSMMYENLGKAIKKDPAYRSIARTDLEFAKYLDDQNFKLLFQ